MAMSMAIAAGSLNELFNFKKAYEAYSGERFNLKSRPSCPMADEGARTISNPLRTSKVEMNPIGSVQPWFVSSDDGSLSGTTNTQHPIGTRTLPKPELQSEHRGLGRITAAALQAFGQEEKSAPRRSRKSSKYPGEMLLKACMNFEQFCELAEG